ncbi:hypothetical protein PVMG_02555 [Plasmodium vivax Mauritania I]|uniref:Pv-fam-c protein n=1 Tax=Plasmodium vivax Mauritania I TaxID=1035515 RepID=A0A0J9TI13_PLAVI|nr:hypothetical protein PVMG_02555 [Plasmodium vivax Mauritania I]
MYRRNIDIIHGVSFGTILRHIHDQNINGIKSWIKEYENKLTAYLNKRHKSLKDNDLVKYCTNLNYILDYIVQGINNLKMFDCVYWTHQVDEGSKKALKKYPSLYCERDLHNYKNKHLFFKKLMLDLCEDIEYFVKKKKYLKYNNCLKIRSRLQYRKETLMQLFHTFYHKEMFDIKDECSISFIYNKFSDISCNKVEKQPKTIVASEGAIDTTSSSADRADQLKEGAKETEDSQDPSNDDGLNNLESVDPVPDDLTFSLPFNEDPPKLDTTYAAASLAGISLFGTILYKVKYYYINEILFTSFIFYINIMLI